MKCCRDKPALLHEQRTDLAECLDRLVWEIRCGVAQFKTYRQFKMRARSVQGPAAWNTSLTYLTATNIVQRGESLPRRGRCAMATAANRAAASQQAVSSGVSPASTEATSVMPAASAT